MEAVDIYTMFTASELMISLIISFPVGNPVKSHNFGLALTGTLSSNLHQPPNIETCNSNGSNAHPLNTDQILFFYISSSFLHFSAIDQNEKHTFAPLLAKKKKKD